MNLQSHHFSKMMNKKLSRFLPPLHRAEILTIFCLYFGRNDDFINSFWNCLIFNTPLPKVRQSNLIFFSLGPILQCSSSQQETKNNGSGLYFHGPTGLKPEKNVDWIRNGTFQTWSLPTEVGDKTMFLQVIV